MSNGEDGAYLKGVEDGIAAERERCAKIARTLWREDGPLDECILAAQYGNAIAEAIRKGE